MRVLVHAGVVALAAGLSGSGAAAEDLTIVCRATTGTGAPARSTQYVSAGKVRTSDGEHDTIFDAASGRITLIDHHTREYFEFTRDEMAAALRQLDQQMRPAGPLADQATSRVVGAVTVRRTGASRKVAGYDCDEYTVTLGESVRYDVCAARSLPPPAAYFEALKGRYALMGPAARRFDRTFDEMKTIGGLPLSMRSSVRVMMVRSEATSEATEISKGPIPASAFEVPAGYKKRESPFGRRGSDAAHAHDGP
jgi:hypothetical protein